jgi:hypothetical protein
VDALEGAGAGVCWEVSSCGLMMTDQSHDLTVQIWCAICSSASAESDSRHKKTKNRRNVLIDEEVETTLDVMRCQSIPVSCFLTL